MKIGRYRRRRECESRVFLVRENQNLVDGDALQDQNLPERVREAGRLVASNGNDGFCSALPLLEGYLRLSPCCLDFATSLPEDIQFEPPTSPRTFICVGLNYRDHAAESKMDLPKAPLLFAKTANAITAHNCCTKIPSSSSQVDYEAELAIVIGTRCRNVTRAEALKFVAGYTCGNDLSARDFQFADGQWYRGKSCDGFGPLGPWLATKSDVVDPQNLRIQLRLNGAQLQDSNTSNLVFDVSALVEYVSTCMTLEPGDVILTGTPPGVGFSRKPPVFLKCGDVVEVEIESIGTLVTRIC